ncbi:MAG: hypothetical protein QNJ73_10125 [Gammaproteobacteria bacterium]|nr:hypothetical protein [Gammaproteobacteria bacterium]
MDTHSIWLYVHILLFVYWLGADVGLYMIMSFVKNPTLSFETRKTLIKLAFYIDQFPRVTFALILPVGLHLTLGFSLYPVPDWLLATGWIVGVAWGTLHLAVLRFKGTALAAGLSRINQAYELLMGGIFVFIGVKSLLTGAPLTADWFAVKLLLFGFVFWVVLGIDTVFQPFTMILRMGPDGLTPGAEAEVTRQTHLTMAWALLMYLLVLAVAFLGTVKPVW